MIAGYFPFSVVFFFKCRTVGVFYQTAHFDVGFIALLAGQLKSLANCGMLENGPRTRKRDGEWAPVRMRNLSDSGRDFWHQTFAAPIQNNWRTLFIYIK